MDILQMGDWSGNDPPPRPGTTDTGRKGSCEFEAMKLVGVSVVTLVAAKTLLQALLRRRRG